MNKGFTFGSFCLMPQQRLLLKGGCPVQIGSRAFDVLVVLIEHPGEIVGKRELMARVWPSTVVCEDNLFVQISFLRRVLREGGARRCIVNVPGRGYLFVQPVDAYVEQTPLPRRQYESAAIAA